MSRQTEPVHIERLFEMWTDPEHLAAWMPPPGATMHFLRADPRVGGSSLYTMTFPDGAVMHGLITYLAIEKPLLITYTQQFCDAQERVIRPPFFKDWPLTMQSTIEFAAESPERTRVTVRWEPREATDADLAEFMKQRGSMTMGWTGSFDKLEAALG